VVLILPIAVLAVLLGMLFWNRSRSSARQQPLNVSFTVVGEMQPRSLADFRGRVILFNLWSTGVPESGRNLLTLNALSERYASQGLLVVAVSDEDMNRLSRFPLVRNAKFLAGGVDSRTAQSLPGDRPYSFLLDRDGKVVEEYKDTLEIEVVEKTLKPMLGQ
jgi:hypothetical protein